MIDSKSSLKSWLYNSPSSITSGNFVNKADIAWSTAYQDLQLTEEEEALGEAAKLMTLMELFKDEEQYEKCAIIKGRMAEVNRILRKNNRKKWERNQC